MGASPVALTPLTARARRTLARPALALGWVAISIAALPAITGVSLSPTARYAPLVASAVVFGMPHGAIDYLALPRAVTGTVTVRWLAVVGVLYLVLGGGYAAAWFFAPVPAAFAFVAITWLHWGQGDLYPLLDFLDVDYLDTRPRRAATVLIRGGLPMLVPLLGFPERYRSVVDAFAAPFGGSVGDLAVFDPRVRLWLGVAFAAATVAVLAAGRRRTHSPGAWRVDAAETLLLWVFFFVVPPVFAVGVYFCVWHSVRHVARAIAVDGSVHPSLRAGDILGPLARFGVEAAPMTAAALALGGVLWWAVPNPPTTLESGAALYLVLIAVLTLPHVAVVTWMDRVQGVL
ncbi:MULTISPECIES: Brp/Blh family beta-carotene 15,15'-dioxygenase [Halobacterium]|uniref:Probable beta-carotene 15,15'-dioxygenase Blh n=6 Tax=Halobacterium salinarum TaxID=2242 RepID=BLH_HALSA|nr:MULTISPECIES: Brp/Blh family beta-carotene 15,15'-dioxygenase [Halobacterium]Q9HNE6.2 RecName: Full=Probable beta-carotene 15,15'-dioxygenase Blh; AltName: Full=Brp-like homolog [Halobacterium salinarum NRC-1]MBB6089291.1 Brp/Blh family beta-carotene 15,15'-monooxygenase [Halobacterium salinarum]MDL0119190.1 Brp/Blh family beta-carotene 15,15'-dioxygenase [Halobacterium salinarum]MDL0122020.1 Brp/Blh family beta-carotene 15,15'-dioxygenase [Halobacterium salinarum]MDL0127223.1 Brp/Blh famil